MRGLFSYKYLSLSDPLVIVVSLADGCRQVRRAINWGSFCDALIYAEVPLPPVQNGKIFFLGEWLEEVIPNLFLEQAECLLAMVDLYLGEFFSISRSLSSRS